MINMDKAAEFQKIDYGTRVSTVDITVVSVTIDPTVILNDYAKATVQEMQRMNPEKYASIESRCDAISLQKYFTFLLFQRVQYVSGEIHDWRQIRTLYMPAWIQFAISCVGEVVVQEYGLKFIPTLSREDCGLSDYTLNDALSMSDILRSFKFDGLSVLDDGFPRSKDGEKDTMSLALMGTYMRGPWPVSHPIYTYVAAFLGLKIMESNGLSMIYRCRYDDISFLATMMLHDERLIR